jgi:phosphoglycolate phosphatase-like HAD superfamily hydrolase
MPMTVYTKEDLTSLEPQADTLVGIDSDGCVFDTMEVKQKRFFHGRIVRFWGLEPIESHVRQAAEFVNLYSRWRGSNRFRALLKVFQLLHEWPEAVAAGIALPDCRGLQTYVESGLPLGNPTLEAEVRRTGSAELQRALDWSLEINEAIAAEMPAIPPFEWARKSLVRIHRESDAIVVSQTPEEALVSEWHKHGIDGCVRVIAGQELGTKAEHIRMASAGRWSMDRVLLIGDSLNDLAAARDAGCRFFPINPGTEEESWRHFLVKGYDRFLDGTYGGGYEKCLIRKFEGLLPATPPWLKGNRPETPP